MLTTTRRVTERDLIQPTIDALKASPSNFMTTSELIAHLAELFDPIGMDDKILRQRRDTYFSQKVRNMICHRANRSSFLNVANPAHTAVYTFNSKGEGGIALAARAKSRGKVKA